MNKKEEIMAFPSDFGKINRFGMTLRDYFAAKIIASLIQGSFASRLLNPDAIEELQTKIKAAYKVADEMLKQREL